MTPPKILTVLIAFVLAADVSQAVSGTWLAAPTSDNWNTAANWDPSNPGSGTDITNIGSTDIATFSAASSITTINLGAARSLGGFTFDTAAASAYTIAGGAATNRFLLTRGMTSQITSTVTNPQVISTRVRIAAGITGADSRYTLQNDATTTAATFILSGELLNIASAPAALVLRGSNTGSNMISGAIGELNALSGLSLTKEDAGTWILAASNSYTRGTVINNGLLTVATNDALGTGPVTMTNGSLLAQDGVTVENAITVGVAAGVATNFSPVALAGWNMNGLAVNASTAAVTTAASGVTGQSMDRGTGVTNGAVANALGGAGWNFTTAADSISNNSFITFGLAASSTNSVLRLSTLAPFFYRSSSSGPTNATLQYSTDGGASFTDLFTTNGYTRNITDGTFDPIDVSSAGTILQNVGTNGVVFRWVNFGATSGGGTFYVRNGSGNDDLVINGEVGTIVSNTVSGTGIVGTGEAVSATFSGDVTINNTATLTAATNGTATFSGAIGGAGSLVKGGTGTVTLSASNSYAGGTTVGTGMLTIANNNALGTGLVTINGGGLANSSGAGRTIPNNVLFGGNATLGGAPGGASLTINGTTDLGGAVRTLAMSNSITFAGVVTNGGLIVNASAGSRRLTFAAATNGFTGGLTINGGALQIGNGGTTGTLLGLGTLSNNAAQLAFSRSDNIAQNDVYPAGPIGGTISLAQLGTGTLTLNAAHTYTGNTAIINGTLLLATNGSLTFKIGGAGTNNGLIGTGTTVINGSFVFDLSTASTDTNSTWTIVADTLANSYGTNFFVSGFSGTVGGNWTNTTNGVRYVFAQPTGVLSVQPTSGVTPYNAWVTYWQGVNPGFTNTAATGDPDGDLFDNNMEFAFDGNPMVGNGAFLTATKVGTNAVFNFVARKDPPGGATYAVQRATNLAAGPWTNAPVTVSNSVNQSGLNIPADYERKEFVVPATGVDFYRVLATVAP